jgi:septal ring factor EnvC (AmiA/AmiB activator)
MHDKQEALRQIDTEIGQMNTKKDSLAAAVDDVRTSIAVVLTGIRKIGKDVESLNNEIARIGNANDRLQAEIALLEQRRGLIDHARLVKEPTPSLYPVFPRKVESVIVAGLLGAIFFTGIALFADRLQSRSRLRTVAAARAEAMLPWAAAAGHAVTALGRSSLYSEKIVSSQEEPRVGDVTDRLNPAARVGRAVGGAHDL